MYEHYRIWAVYHPSEDELSRTLVDDVKGKLLGKVLPCGELELKRKDKEENLVIKSNSSASNTFIFRDPRLHELGLRVVCPTSEDVPQLLGVTRGSSYRHFRYSLGVGEGAHDIIPEESLPLESNCDYLHGISFHKGCYIGQELTARAYHTGVIRKRLMPITLESSVVEADAIKRGMICNNGRPVARVRGVDGLIALGLVRILDSMSAKTLTVCNTKASTRKPSWWPKSAPKELESRE